MAADEFGGAVHDHVRAEGQGLLQQWRGEGVVDADDGPGAAAGVAQGGKIGHLEQRIGGRLQPEQVRAVHGGLDAGGVGQVNAVDGPASLLLAVGEKLADPEVTVRRGDDAAAGRHEVEHRGDRGHAGGESHRVTALHLAHGCLQCLPARRGVGAGVGAAVLPGARAGMEVRCQHHGNVERPSGCVARAAGAYDRRFRAQADRCGRLVI